MVEEHKDMATDTYDKAGSVAARLGVTAAIVLVCVAATSSAAAMKPVIYPAPPGAPMASDFAVTIDGQPLPVYDSKVAAFGYFSFGGRAVVTVAPSRDFQRVDIRPRNKGIAYSIKGKAITFVLNRPCNLSIELDGDIKRPLFLFANPYEQIKPQPTDPNVLYFEGGKIHEAGEINVRSGQTVYIAGGAIVRGRIRAEGAKNVTILGRGILDGSHRDYKTQMVKLSGCSDVMMRGIVVFNSYGWTIVPIKSDNVNIYNVKIVGWRDNDDGIDIVGCQNLKVSDSFIRTKDDCIAIKASPAYFEEGESGMRDVQNVSVGNSVLWNAEWGNAMEIGFELQTNLISDVLFMDCDIIHVESGGAFTIHNGDYAIVERIRFQDIRVEDSREKLIELRVGLSIYSGDCPLEYHRQNPNRKRSPNGQWVVPTMPTAYAEKRGCIRHIYFKNIEVFGKLPPSYLVGYDDEHTVEKVVVENMRFNGMRVWDEERGNFKLDKAKNVLFIGSGGTR
jgi:hypothetical protein